MPENGTEEMGTEMPNMLPLVTNMPNGQTATQNMPDAPITSGNIPQPTQENVPNISDNHTGTDAQNQTLGKTRSDNITKLYC